MVVPAPVATAFPPLKRRNRGQQCPITAAKATAAMSHSFCTASLATATGTRPLSMSPARVSAAAHFPDVHTECHPDQVSGRHGAKNIAEQHENNPQHGGESIAEHVSEGVAAYGLSDGPKPNRKVAYP